MVGTSKERCREARFPDGVGRATIGPFTFFDRYHIQAQTWIRLIGPLRKKNAVLYAGRNDKNSENVP